MPAAVFTDFTPPEEWTDRQAAGTLWVADVDGVVQAFLAATAHGHRLHIDEFAVAADHQGQGLGRRMLAEVIDWARGRDFSSISLTTFRSVPFNAPFYASVGFREWSPREAPVRMAETLAAEAARGLKDRCAMLLTL